MSPSLALPKPIVGKIYTVGEGDQVLRSAGAHWAFPYPIDEVVKIPITEIQTVESTAGWYATTKAQEAAGTGIHRAR